MPKTAPTCAECGTTFSRNAALTRHMLIHSQVRKFRCEQCDRAFVQPGDLTRHIETHQKDYQHECVDCGAKFQRPFDLRRHRGQAKGISMCPKPTTQRRIGTLADQHLGTVQPRAMIELAECPIAGTLAQDDDLESFDALTNSMEMDNVNPTAYEPPHSSTAACASPWQAALGTAE